MKLGPLVYLAFTAAFLVSAQRTSAADWDQWRGPNRNGIVSDFKAPNTWKADSLAKQWTVTVGEGHSSPIIVGDRVYIFSRESDKEVMRCLSVSDGKVIWQEAYAAPYEMNPAARNHGKGPKSTPAAADGRVFALGINGHVSAYDAAKGSILWRKDSTKEFKSTAPVFGSATSPLVDGKNMILHVGGDGSGALTAFDTATGKVNWKWDGDGPAYSSPIVVTLGGVRQIITQSQEHCVGVSPTDGKLLWKIPFTTPYDQNSVSAVLAGDFVIFGGVQKRTFAVKVSGTTATTAWETNEITMYMSTPVFDGTKLFGMSDKHRGSLFTMNAAQGTVLWKTEGRLGENASLTDIGPALLVLTEGGELTVQQKAGNALKEAMKYKVATSPVWASPAVSGDKILIKDKTNLTLYRVR